MILVCGEALFDMFGRETDTGFTFEAHCAGSPMNVTIGLSRLGGRASLCTGIPNDYLGDRLVRHLVSVGVEHSQNPRLSAPATAAYVTLSDSGAATCAFYGEGGAERSLPADHAINAAGCEAIHFGSYSFVMGSAAQAFQALMRQESGRTFLSYDPNIRPTVEPDMSRWRAALGHATAHCDLINLSDEDAHSLFPGVGLDDVAHRLLQGRARMLFITRGGAGASA